MIRWLRWKLRRLIRWAFARHDERPTMFRLTPLGTRAVGSLPTVEMPPVTTADLFFDAAAPTTPSAYLPPELRPVQGAYIDLEWDEVTTLEIHYGQ